MLQRRTFLKVGSVLGLLKYTEIFALVPQKHMWVEDLGNSYIVRVPDGKTFANEILEKPTLFLMGSDSVVRNIAVSGFSNFYLKANTVIHDCKFDASKYVALDRPVVWIHSQEKSGASLSFDDCEVCCQPNPARLTATSKGGA